MYSGIQIAQYFLSKDPSRLLFTKNLIELNGHTSYEGNIRLNKYLHLAQNLYIAKTGSLLFAENLFAYANGAAELGVQESYAVLWSRSDVPALNVSDRDFLDRFYKAFFNADIEELVELSHEDDEWIDKHSRRPYHAQQMNSLARVSEYQSQYRDMLAIMERMKL